jgi:hypothetical protein
MTFIYPCIASISLKHNQQDEMFSRSLYFYELLYMFQVVPPPIIRSTKLYIQRQVLSTNTVACWCRGWDGISHPQYCCLLLSWMRCSISSTITVGSSIGLTIPDAVCTVLYSWWWVEESPEICRSIHINKQIEKTLHLVGCALEMCVE